MKIRHFAITVLLLNGSGGREAADKNFLPNTNEAKQLQNLFPKPTIDNTCSCAKQFQKANCTVRTSCPQARNPFSILSDVNA